MSFYMEFRSTSDCVTILRGGERFHIRARSRQHALPDQQFQPDGGWPPLPSVLLKDKRTEVLFSCLSDHPRMRIRNELPACAQNHMCTYECLIQPAMTKVCSSIRRETLPVFYRVNKIHLEMENLNTGGSTTVLAKWYRATGDTNIGSIRKLNIFVEDGWDGKKKLGRGKMYRYRRTVSRPTLTRKEERWPVLPIADTDEATEASWSSFVPTESADREQKLRRIFGSMAKSATSELDGDITRRQSPRNGRLHARALENITALFAGVCCLPDTDLLGPEYDAADI